MNAPASTTSSIIQSLAALRSRALDRQEPIDRLHTSDDWARHEAMLASRCWSRQSRGLADAILAEPPEGAADALSVLLVVEERFEEELIMGDLPENSQAAAVCEQLRIALANCIVALAAACPPSTELERQNVRCCERRRVWWLPPARSGAPVEEVEQVA